MSLRAEAVRAPLLGGAQAAWVDVEVSKRASAAEGLRWVLKEAQIVIPVGGRGFSLSNKVNGIIGALAPEGSSMTLSGSRSKSMQNKFAKNTSKIACQVLECPKSLITKGR